MNWEKSFFFFLGEIKKWFCLFFLDRLLTKAEEPSQPCYLTRIWREKLMSFKAFMQRKTQLNFSINIPPASMFIIRSGTLCFLYLSCLQYALGVKFSSPFTSLRTQEISSILLNVVFVSAFLNLLPLYLYPLESTSHICWLKSSLSVGKLSSIHFNMRELLLHSISASLPLFYFCFSWLLKLSWLKTRSTHAFELMAFLFDK